MRLGDARLDNGQEEIRIVTTTDVTAEPVALADLKAHLRVDFTDDDALITALGVAARRLVEAWTGHRMMPRQERLLLDFFPPSKRILIPAWPVTAVSQVAWYDQDNTVNVFDPTKYVVDVNGPIGRVALKYGVVWPILASNRRPVNAVAVDFASGYVGVGSPADPAAAVPEPLKLAIKMLAGHLYENREASTPLTVNELPLGVKHMLTPYRVWEAFL